MAAFELVATSSLGSLLGMRHALEPDHLAAVSTLVTAERRGTAVWLGVCWGIGHTLTLMLAGAALVVLRAEMPAVADDLFELAVVLLLLGFGVRAIRQAAVHTSAIDLRARNGAGTGNLALARRPLLVGAVHGLAGSGALTAVVVATLPTTAARLSYLALFGLGSIVGMGALTGLLGWPLQRLGGRRHAISLAIGLVSTALGGYWGYALAMRICRCA